MTLSSSMEDYLEAVLVLRKQSGVDPQTAEKEACRMEHGISEASFHKLKDA